MSQSNASQTQTAVATVIKNPIKTITEQQSDTEYVLQQATIDDVASIQELEQLTFQDECYSIEEIETLVVHPNYITFVIHHNHDLIGYLSLNLYECKRGTQKPTSLYIKAICVAQKYRKRGFGKRLMECALVQAKKFCCDRIYLHVKQSNTSAQKLYESFGFTITHTSEKYYKHEDAFVMSKMLV